MTKAFLMLTLLFAAFFFAAQSRAQLAAPNLQGVSMGHVHLLVTDLPANLKFWTMLGGKPIQIGSAIGLKFPDVFIILEKGQPTAGTAESVVNHIGFHVPNVQESFAKWKASGVKIDFGQSPQQGYIYSPDGLTKIEMLEDASLSLPIVFHHVHLFAPPSATSPDPAKDMQAWYAEIFAATPGKRGPFLNASLPGGEMTFSKSDAPTFGAKGRSVDHIGFEVKNLQLFCKALQAKGIKLDTPYTPRPDLGIALAYLTDPWGTYIELTEGLASF